MSILSSILHLRKLLFKEVLHLAQGHRGYKGRVGDSDPRPLDHRMTIVP